MYIKYDTFGREIWFMIHPWECAYFFRWYDRTRFPSARRGPLLRWGGVIFLAVDSVIDHTVRCLVRVNMSSNDGVHTRSSRQHRPSNRCFRNTPPVRFARRLLIPTSFVFVVPRAVPRSDVPRVLRDQTDLVIGRPATPR